MIQFLLTLRRLVRGLVGAWRRDPRFRSLALLVVFTLLGGTIFYTTVEGWSVVDAFYFSVTTLTTVGLGGLAPSTTFGKLFTAVYIFAGVGLLAVFVSAVAQGTLGSGGRGPDGGEDDEDAIGG